MPATTKFEALCFAPEGVLIRSCVDCGRVTGRFCDGIIAECYAEDRVPGEKWGRGQRTPLCSECDNRKLACHFCRGLSWRTPPEWR